MSTAATLPTPSPLKATQSGSYTKAQFQNTIEGARNVKSSEEIEKLLRDYPSALELYRSGKYKVKVKCEADVERVILVEKRSVKSKTTSSTKDESQENTPAANDSKVSDDEEVMTREVINSVSQHRTHPQDRQETVSAEKANETIVQTASSSIRVPSNTQPKVDHYRKSSKERAASITPPNRSYPAQTGSSNDSQHQVPYPPSQGRTTARDYPKTMGSVTTNPMMPWLQQRTVHPYMSNPLLQKAQGQSIYMTPTLASQQNPMFRQNYFPSQRTVSSSLQSTGGYPMPPTKVVGKTPSFHASQNFMPSRIPYNPIPTIAIPPNTFRTVHAKQDSITPSHPVYQSQIPIARNFPWTAFLPGQSRPVMNNYEMFNGQRKNIQDRSRSVDPTNRRNPSMFVQHCQQPMPVSAHYQTRPQPVPAPQNIHGRQAEHKSESKNQPTKETTTGGNCEKLSIRQLHETFVQIDPAGRLPIISIPEILQRFGINLTSNDLTSAAQELQYNPNDPVSARRLIHILVKLGRIAKSTRPPVSYAGGANEPGQMNTKSDPSATSGQSTQP